MAAPFHILHVDDDALMRDLVELSLAPDPGFLLLSCASGEEALRVVPDWAPDLILCDIMMPDMDGETLLKRLRAEPATASFPVVFMTACTAPRDGGAMTTEGATAIIAKPFDPATLAETLRRHLHTIKLNAAGYDFRQRLRRDAATLTSFRRGLPAAGPPPELQSFVHKLAGAAGIFNYRAVAAQASALEAAIIAARDGSAAPRRVAQGLDALLAAIEQALPGSAPSCERRAGEARQMKCGR
jgi:two-component system OmpR family response regulator